MLTHIIIHDESRKTQNCSLLEDMWHLLNTEVTFQFDGQEVRTDSEVADPVDHVETEWEQNETSDNLSPDKEKEDMDWNDFKENLNEPLYSENSSNGELNQKMPIKNEAAKYPCNMCDYQAKRKKNLNSHMKSIHHCMVYSCDQCEVKYKPEQTQEGQA